MNNIRKNHHFVSQSYLKAWANDHKKVWTYRTLVSHSSVPEWSQSSVKSLANHQYLFTRSMVGADSDEIEIWMDQEIESPAQSALSKVRSNKALSKGEWELLLRFIALQDIRNPERYIEQMERWKLEMPALMEEAMYSALDKFEMDLNNGASPVHEVNTTNQLIPMKVTKEIEPGSEKGRLKTELLLGRSIWLFSIRHLLSSTYKVLNQHTWSILRAPGNLKWITSDNPLIRLNYYGNGSYDLKGGWGNKGTDIIFPLSPEFLLHTQVGNKSILNTVTEELAMTINRFIAENAHRHILSQTPIKDMSIIMPRVVDQASYEHEKREWETWHIRQKRLEQEY
ncbi:DUF4238 domain-containing protein [Paenibacillus phytohabitans]|uniref:DUF4238 domain-containing protein n=1 Tax=Paenibacillus phytohabitans TaxID=2654978 RepID=UPI00300A9A01